MCVVLTYIRYVLSAVYLMRYVCCDASYCVLGTIVCLVIGCVRNCFVLCIVCRVFANVCCILYDVCPVVDLFSDGFSVCSAVCSVQCNVLCA